jgi:hypothetical protein
MLREKSEKQRDRLTVLHETVKKVTRSLDLDQVLDATVSGAINTLSG